MNEGTVYLKCAKPSFSERRSHLFRNPERIYSGGPDDFSWEKLRHHSKTGIVAGYLSYDLGESLSGLSRGSGALPAFWFGVYDRVLVLDEIRGSCTERHSDGSRRPAALPDLPGRKPFELRFDGFDQNEKNYRRALGTLREGIAGGHYYQVNYTLRGDFRLSGDPYSFFSTLLDHQPVPYGSFIDTSSGILISGSPELFLRVKGGRAISKPMKGTIRAGKGAGRRLKGSEKNRAENLMIVDLVRNDLGRVASEVQVRDLFRVERYATVHQMVSTVEALLNSGIDAWGCIASCFPPGSVTGTPKSSAMEAIADLETTPRGVYTGVIGYAAPWDEACFSVAIRTAEIAGNRLTYGTGGGITMASDPTAEWQECLDKIAVMRDLSG